MAVGSIYLDKIKMAVGLTANTFDADVSDLIESARAELSRVGIDRALINDETNPLIRLAVRTFVQSEYAENENEAVRLKASFNSQAIALSKTSGYGTEVAYDEV